MKKIPQPLIDLLISFLGAAALGAVIAAFSAGSFWQGWLAAGVLSFVTLFLLIKIWRSLSGGKTLAALMLTAFLLRIAVGIFVYVALPSIGYDTPVQNAGYFYSDAFNRDQAAYQLAAGSEPLITAFTKPTTADQYGGLLFMSALIYRILSIDVIRPLLISLLAAFAMAAGAGFLYMAVQKRWSQKIALLAGWIFVLFPDSILLGSTQMREPFLIGLTCLSFWAVLQWRENPLKAILVPAVAMVVACLFSYTIGLMLTTLLAVVFLLEWTLAQKDWKRSAGLAAMILLALVAVFGGWMWLKQTLYFDAYTTRIESGWITMLMEKFGEKWNIPFVTVYGLTQPLLPAAFFEPSLPIWMTVAILRSLAWYAALPLLLFGALAVWKADRKEHRWLLVTLFVVFLVWVVVSSARAGGDLWDNPRYRYILLPFLSLILAWAIDHYNQTRSLWLWRWVAAIGVFLAFFFYFYITRYIVGIIPTLPFLWMIILITGIDVLILGGSLLWDKLHTARKTV
jgi:4-amino-4-deoxy-L-arabinose transferase-like glycosyltransferase